MKPIIPPPPYTGPSDHAQHDGYRLYHHLGSLSVAHTLSVGGRQSVGGDSHFHGSVEIDGTLTCHAVKGQDCGLYATAEQLRESHPTPSRGQWAYVLSGTGDSPAVVSLYGCIEDGRWSCLQDDTSLSAPNLPAYDAVVNVVTEMSNHRYQFAGIATPESQPSLIDPCTHNVYYLATVPGTYPYFGGLRLRYPSVLMYECATGEWHAAAFGDTARVLEAHFDRIRSEVSVTSCDFVGKDGDTDLTLSDEQDHDIVQFRNGHVVTKHFDSQKTVHHTDIGNVDYCVSDEQNNDILQVVGGYPRTKRFDGLAVTEMLQQLEHALSALLPALAGQRLSVVGDSISTYSGTLPSDTSGYDGVPYHSYYPLGDVNQKGKMWWQLLCDHTGMTLLRNCSWSGSSVCGDASSTTDAECGCSLRRVSDLAERDEYGTVLTAPDMVVIWMGINDFGPTPTPLGTWDGRDAVPAGTGMVSTFSEGYALLVSRVMSTYPHARVLCCTLPCVGKASKDSVAPGVYPTKNSAGTALCQYNDTIRTVALALGAKVIDLSTMGMHFWNMGQYTLDSLHPNAAGMEMVARAFLHG